MELHKSSKGSNNKLSAFTYIYKNKINIKLILNMKCVRKITKVAAVVVAAAAAAARSQKYFPIP